ncbi:hypothetical protein O6072_18330 [Mycolicibacterium neoaurum]|uniref:hypothetical protein n=1 Tax=Mycolicibacterium neoaurum TaxID=1795 RepID=UPI00248C28E3|nr:hypothetical protein [Mycolicibacterium neoaurum]WBP93221.1 hypothetical protein O7W24_18915 [Mycolicibacterium neoaurum]WBS06812.1 hypothetical protein O6072_18330 [Mycolicibacterium neoaurum]
MNQAAASNVDESVNKAHNEITAGQGSGKTDTETKDGREQFEGMPTAWYAPGGMYRDEIPQPGPLELSLLKKYPELAHRALTLADFLEPLNDRDVIVSGLDTITDNVDQ